MATSALYTQYLWWVVSRASGIVAIAAVSIAVLIGLTMSTRSVRRPGAKRALMRLHEHVALIGLVAIAVHGLALLGDRWLHPSVGEIAVPFTISYRTAFTGMGVLGGYLAALLGLSFYLRRRIGAKRWRALHRATVLVWVLGVVHTLGAGTDAATLPLRALLLATGIPIVYLASLRVLQSIAPQRRRFSTASAQSRTDAIEKKGARDGLPAADRRVGMRGTGRLRRAAA